MSLEHIITKIQNYIKDKHHITINLTEGDTVTFPKDKNTKQAIYDNTPLIPDLIDIINEYINIKPLIMMEETEDMRYYHKNFIKNINNVVWQYFDEERLFGDMEYDRYGGYAELDSIIYRETYIFKQDNVWFPYIAYIKNKEEDASYYDISRYEQYMRIPRYIVN